MYNFVNVGIVKPIPVWGSVRDELRVIRGLMVFATTDLRAPSSRRVTMNDACLSGYGVGEALWRLEEVDTVVASDARWRSKDANTSSDHREREL